MCRKLEATTVELHWVYTPSDFLEEPVIWDRGSYRVELKDGRVTVCMAGAYYATHPDLAAKLDAELRAYLQGTVLSRHIAFELRRDGSTHILPDGRRQVGPVHVSATAASFFACAEAVIVHGESGFLDPHQERIAETQRLANLALRVAPNDRTACKLLECYDAAVRDPANELVYLYEIWEGIVNEFGGRKAKRVAKQTLGIDEARLTALACGEPIKQGRHRGRHHNLRDATPQELDEARSIARHMLVRYLEYRDSPPR